MPDDFDLVVDEIVRDIAREQQATAEKIVADVQDRVGKPVGYRIGPRGGETKIRSKRGEPPRKDTGRLQRSINAETIEVGDQIATSINPGDVPYAEPLQMDLDRPIFSDELDATTDLILDRTVEAIENP